MKNLDDLKQNMIDCLDSLDLNKMCTIDLLNIAHIMREISEMDRVDYMNVVYDKLSDNVANGIGVAFGQKGEGANG